MISAIKIKIKLLLLLGGYLATQIPYDLICGYHATYLLSHGWLNK